jgi:hypothetical protein
MLKTSARRSAFVLALPIFLIIFNMGCERNPLVPGSTAAARPEATPTVAATPAVDRELDDRFAFAAGLPAGSPAFAAWQEEPAWKDFSKTAGEMCAEFNSAVLEPMRAWAAVDLGAAREKTSTLFYPFGGPDFATAFALFPQASKIVLLGLEPVGNLTDFGRLSSEGRASFFADMGALAFDFLTRGYFVTMRMLETYSRGNVDGALPVIGFFLKRGGYSVVDVRRLAPDEKGGWTETPYERLASRPHRPYGVRIDYVKPGDSVLRSVTYFSCDVENKAFREDSSLHKFCEGLERMTTFVKAGSYLLHWDNFSILRRLILDGSLFVLEDDTAVPYRFFKSGGWKVTLFGRYATPVKDFTNVEQPDLRQAYEDPEGKVKPLPFHFGYRWRTQVDNLLLAERPRRPYKVPVVK